MMVAVAQSDGVISIPGAEKRVVIYTTSLRIVRSTFEACRTVKSILRGFRISIDERDLSMDSRFLHELQNLMSESGDVDVDQSKLELPRVFIGGEYIGGAEEVRQLHETGELKKFVERLQAVAAGVCEVCGDFRFIMCDECRGSRKCYSEKGGLVWLGVPCVSVVGLVGLLGREITPEILRSMGRVPVIGIVCGGRSLWWPEFMVMVVA
ncbi:uncharacterized protein At5g39865-like [Bidens hawaiensis]|uniref:uncharacterized protein At5g39865-like n=1 Tax=Bidens hawaiensis TaxID=980011 RepID=UPI004049DCED